MYEGRLKSTNERVAVKLQYIDLQDRFTGDMLTIRMILYAIGKVFPKFEFSWIIDSVKTNLERELDFKLEGQNADRCYAQLSPHLKYIYVPKVFWEHTTKRVLVMEYIDGIKVSDTQKLQEANLSLKEVDTKLVEAMAFQIFHCGFVHADPHVCQIKNNRYSFYILHVFIAWKCLCKKRSKNTNEIKSTNCSIGSWFICNY